ncbi:MAG: signal peptidase I [Dehalococcoidia bacterium]
MSEQSRDLGNRGISKSLPTKHAGGAARVFSRAVLLTSFVAACMIYGVGFMAVLLDARPMIVTSGSMRPTINQGDALIVRPASSESIRVGDIITFQNFGKQNLTTHRVLDVREISGLPWYQTKGDNNNTPDQDLTPYGAVFGKVRVVLPRVGYLLGFVATPSGALLIISLPLFIMLVQEILLFGSRGNQGRPETNQANAIPDETAEQN